MKINLKSLKVKIFIFYIASFTMLFGVILSINYFIFEDFAKDSEVKKAQTIAELIASNIAVPLQLGLVEEVKGEVYKQADTNKNILEISILQLEGGKTGDKRRGGQSSDSIKVRNPSAPNWRNSESGSSPSGRNTNLSSRPSCRWESALSSARQAASRPALSPS